MKPTWVSWLRDWKKHLVNAGPVLELVYSDDSNPLVARRKSSSLFRVTKRREVNPRMRMLWGIVPYFDGVILGALTWPSGGTVDTLA